MKKKISLLLCLVLVFSCIVGLLVACKPDNGPSDVLDKGRTINVYSWWDPTKPGIVGMKNGFEEKYKEYGVKLNFVMVGSYYETMMTKLAAGQDAIDVMMLASDQVPTFAKNGVIRPLTDNVTEEYLNDLYPAVKSGLYYNNEVYAVARDVTTKAAIINKDLFAEKNVPIPGDDWTWDDFNRIIKALSDKQNQKWGFTYDNNADPLFPLFYLQNAKYFDAEKKESYLDSP
ncbi:MAG: extracellular solute-binding protein, partial [Clostridia bacterium]